MSDILRDGIEIIIPKDESDNDLILPLIRKAHKEATKFDLSYDESVYLDILQNARIDPFRAGCFYISHKGIPSAYTIFMQQPLMRSEVHAVTSVHSAYIISNLRGSSTGSYILQAMITLIRAWSIQRRSRGIMFNYTIGMHSPEFNEIKKDFPLVHLGGNYFIRT